MYNELFFPNVNKQIVNGDKVSYTGILVASKFNQKNGQDYKLLDLVDIDFNGAWIPSMNTYMFTAQHLINVLDQLNKSNELGQITQEIEDIWNQIDEITASYITYSSLDGILQEGWQRKLTAGTYISIDNSYTISVVDLPTYDYLKDTYTSLNTHKALQQYIIDNYYDKLGTYNIAYQAAYDAILRVIDGADNAFDTLKEISDWILEQNRYTQIPWGDVANDWKEDYYYVEVIDETTGLPTGKYKLASGKPEGSDISEITNPQWIVDNWQEDYYYYVNDKGKYILVTNPDYVDLSGDTIYYSCDIKYFIEENYLTDIQNLITRVNRLDDSVGFKEWDEFTSSYSYTGHYLDIYELQKKDDTLNKKIDYVGEKLIVVETISNIAYSFAYSAYTTAYTAYEIAYTALENSVDSIDKANQAYDMAYDAIIKVGTPSIQPGMNEIDNIENIQSYRDNGFSIYYKEGDKWVEVTEPPYDENIQYYYYNETYIEGTGLTKRVEDTEKISKEANERSKVSLLSSYESLYYLTVDNRNSTYVNLALQPNEFLGDRRRTISITTDNASINPKTGEVYSDGLVGLNTAFDIYTYASSWMMLYVDNDVNFEDLE